VHEVTPFKSAALLGLPMGNYAVLSDRRA